jgi:hypothetical protein
MVLYRLIFHDKGMPAMIEVQNNQTEERNFAEFRRKVRSAEVLSASTGQLLRGLRFTGRLSIIVRDGQVLKSGYEEGYFRQVGSEAGDRLQ